MTSHPAKFSPQVLALLPSFVQPTDLVLDPFSGTGLIHNLNARTIGNEIEWEWASMRTPSVVGDALMLPFPNSIFDVVITSCVYGNRMSDHHNAKDGSRRLTYTHTLGRKLHPNNSGAMQWGEEYRRFHVKAWMQVRRVLKPGCPFILNVSNHIRQGRVMRVTEWHINMLIRQGFLLEQVHMVETPRMKYGENRELRVGHENVLVFVKG